ncbi:PaaI family thioesterase [Chryseobacterium sp. JAH]|uniref:PaaI family thioesterase n=1 Tax=Chryseobacterium sp. JAH TaxID=1742858 RepID=UPI000A81CEA2|nr:PaaI family thioesterase [Chryseobacterium sp. JAH]
MKASHTEYIRAGIPKQNLMKLYNAYAGIIEDGFVEVIIPRQESLIRGAGFFYGGVLAAAVDTAAYFSAATLHEEDAYFVTVDLKINYLNPAQGELLTTAGEVIKNGKTLIICKADCFTINAGSKKLVATSLVTLMKIQK